MIRDATSWPAVVLQQKLGIPGVDVLPPPFFHPLAATLLVSPNPVAYSPQALWGKVPEVSCGLQSIWPQLGRIWRPAAQNGFANGQAQNTLYRKHRAWCTLAAASQQAGITFCNRIAVWCCMTHLSQAHPGLPLHQVKGACAAEHLGPHPWLALHSRSKLRCPTLQGVWERALNVLASAAFTQLVHKPPLGDMRRFCKAHGLNPPELRGASGSVASLAMTDWAWEVPQPMPPRVHVSSCKWSLHSPEAGLSASSTCDLIIHLRLDDWHEDACVWEARQPIPQGMCAPGPSNMHLQQCSSHSSVGRPMAISFQGSQCLPECQRPPDPFRLMRV